jgi:tRNA(Ile)-lysidine synthase
MRTQELEERFEAALLDLTPNLEKKFICAFSGGPDSTALLALLTNILPPERLLAAHLNHNIRPQSRTESQKAAEIAAHLKVPFFLGEAEALALAKNRGRGLEEAARKARYDFLTQTAKTWGGDYIATGHQANDQAETILLKIFRGGGPSSLVGIRPQKGQIIRPLLGFAREDLLAYLNYRNLPFVLDPSNEDPSFRRNHLRLTVWPELLKHNSALLAALGRAANLALAEEEFWEERIELLSRELAEISPDGRVKVLAAGFGALSLAERRRLALSLLRRAKVPGRAGGENVPLAGVAKFLEFLGESRPNGQGLDLPGGRRVERQGMFLYIGPSSRFNSISSA